MTFMVRSISKTNASLCDHFQSGDVGGSAGGETSFAINDDE